MAACDNLNFISLKWIDDYTYQPYLISLSRDEDNHIKNDDISVDPLEFPITDAPHHLNHVNLVGSCNGIICLRQDRALCLWNPATNQSTNLPPLPILPLRCYVAFGFDPELNDYKVLCIDSNKVNPTVHLYSLISDSWKAIMDTPVPSCTQIRGDLKTPYRNRYYCCWLQSEDYYSLLFLSFDFSKEVFRIISFPEDAKPPQYPDGLFILGESIACVGSWRDAEQQFLGYEIWILNDFDVKEYWTRLYTLSDSLFGDCIYLDQFWMMGFSKNRDFLLLPQSGGSLLCDLVTQRVIHLPVSISQCLPYEESLVSIKRGISATDVDLKFQDGKEMIVNNASMVESNEDVLFRVLLWLPVVSILRFMSVCKSWCALIKSSSFAAQYHHLHHRQNISGDIDLILHTSQPFKSPLFEDSSHPSLSTSCTCLMSNNKLELLDLPYSEIGERESPRITCSFDGIIVIQLFDDYSIYLWNPATNQFKVILEHGSGEGLSFSVGFGLDTENNDYKLVRIYGNCGRRTVDVVKLYSLSTDSWRTLDDEIFSTFERVDTGLPAPYRKRICCWLASIDESTSSHAILSFDLSQEIFGTIQLPDCVKNKESYFLELALLRDNVACISTDEDYLYGGRNWQFDIWIMNEFGVKESWSKLYTVGPFSPDWRMKTEYSMNNKDLLLLQKEGQLYTHDLVAQETRRLPVQIQGPQEYQVVLYKESLVPIRRGDC